MSVASRSRAWAKQTNIIISSPHPLQLCHRSFRKYTFSVYPDNLEEKIITTCAGEEGREILDWIIANPR